MRANTFAAITFGAILAVGAGAQTSTPTSQPAATPAAATPAAKSKIVRRTRPAVVAIPMEAAPPSPPAAPAVVEAQQAADRKLLQQQQAQSAQAAQITDQQVRIAEKQKAAVQQEVRIQDAPGPAQTGVVPAAGPPVAPVNADTRIQDAPGPAQTLAPLPSVLSSQSPAPSTAPPPR